MNTKTLLTNLLLVCLTPVAAQACPSGNPNSLAYIRRENNRCEGLQDRRGSSVFALISFSTHTLSDYPDTLNIRVPSTSNVSPTIEVQSFLRNYRLDNLETRRSSKGFTFALNTSVLKKANIPVRSLLAISYVTRNSGYVYYPVILGQPSDIYEFVINSPERTTFPTFEIRRNAQIVFSNPRNLPQGGQIRFTWKYGNAAPGLYELYIIDGQGQRRTFRFEHNPNSL